MLDDLSKAHGDSQSRHCSKDRADYATGPNPKGDGPGLEGRSSKREARDQAPVFKFSAERHAVDFGKVSTCHLES